METLSFGKKKGFPPQKTPIEDFGAMRYSLGLSHAMCAMGCVTNFWGMIMPSPLNKQNASNQARPNPNGYQSGYQGYSSNAPAHGQSSSQSSNPADLRRDYARDKEFILKGIRDYINENDIDAARELVDRYRNVANDEIFNKLRDTTDQRYALKQRINKLIEEYNYIPNDQHQEKVKICGEICSLDPNNKQFKDNLKHELECIYQKLDDSDLARRMTVCTELARLDRRYEREKKKLEKKYKKSLSQTNRNLPAVSKKDQNLCIGNAVWKYPVLLGKFSPTPSMYAQPVIKSGSVSLKVHTHGISISPGYDGPLKIHYTNIRAIDFVPASGIAGTLAGAAVGGVLGGIVGAIGGALLGSNYSPAIRIAYHDPQKDLDKTITIHTDSAEKANTFIANYKREIDITRRTGRTTSSLKVFASAFGTVLFTLIGIALIAALLMAFFLFMR